MTEWNIQSYAYRSIVTILLVNLVQQILMYCVLIIIQDEHVVHVLMVLAKHLALKFVENVTTFRLSLSFFLAC